MPLLLIIPLHQTLIRQATDLGWIEDKEDPRKMVQTHTFLNNYTPLEVDDNDKGDKWNESKIF